MDWDFSTKMFIKIGYAAFRNVLKRRNERYKDVLVKVHQRMKGIYFMNYDSIYEGRFGKIPSCFDNICKYFLNISAYAFITFCLLHLQQIGLGTMLLIMLCLPYNFFMNTYLFYFPFVRPFKMYICRCEVSCMN